ncbi:hypothetical protein [uncultured Arcticibacterium sp.]|mgnify:CR=1 FL=1|uniref:OmpP1/FadL family transporter n=1 Tax=uncultured Arcticibacterium sp. TaxID=2173042 RepID=UPI0030F7183F
MKKLILSLSITLLSLSLVQAQYGEDAFRFSQYNNYGTARSLGMGGAFTALGGDASSSIVNPAGLGFYNRSEFSISPVFRNLTTTSTYLGTSSNRSSSNFGLGQASVVFSKPGRSGKIKRSNFGISYNTLVNFNNEHAYSGTNERSSIMDAFALETSNSGATPTDLDNEFQPSNVPNQGFADTREAMYYWSYLINPFEDGYTVGELTLPVYQEGVVSESGNLGQLNLSYAANLGDKTYLGASLGLQTLNYNMESDHYEQFDNAEVINEFMISDDLIVSGFGANLSLGAIFKASRNVNVGVNLTTPTILGAKETFYSTVQINPVEGAIEPDNLYTTVESLPNDFKYNITSPLRANAGVSYMLPKKIGMLSVQAEYVGYKGMGIKNKDLSQWSDEQTNAIASDYNNVVNIKGGLELRKSNFRLRGGLNYLGDPINANDGVDRSKLIVSGGLGYRSPKFFIDAAYSANTFDSAYTPYVLSNEVDFDSSLISNKSGNLSFTIGTFF